MAELLRLGSAGFLDDQRSVSPLWRRAGSSSLALGAVAALGLGASAYLGIGYLKYERLISADQMSATSVERANADLQDQLAKLRDRLAVTERTLNSAQSRITNLNDETQKQQASAEQTVTSKTDRIAQLQRSLEDAQRDFHMAEAQRVTLLARLSKAEADLTENIQRQQQFQAGANEWQKKVQQLTTDRDKANAERDQMKLRIEQLELKLSARQTNRSVAQAQPQQIQPQQQAQLQTAAIAAAGLVTAQPAAPAPAIAAPAVAVAQPVPVAATTVAMTVPQPAVAVPAVAAGPVMATPVAAVATVAPPAAPAVVVSGGRLAQLERVLGSAGVDVAHLFAKFGVNQGQGGPFIPVRGIAPNEAMSADKVAALGRLVKALPVSAPLASYEIGSPFGVRGDPINGHAAYHTGLDFRAPYDSPIYATAAGIVTFSGFRDDYGRIVEIDHGNGISTRYAHMHQAIALVGQHIAAHQQIGFLGSSGRATGPHVHYEVLVNGEPQDPTKFMGLGRLVQVSQ